jgi:hypothetical protein
MANPKYARLPEREAQQRTVDELDRVLNPSGAFVASTKQLNTDLLRKRKKAEEERLKEITPKEVETDEQKSFVVQQIARLEKAMVEGNPMSGVPPMPTRQQMDEAGAGDVGQELKWQEHWKRHTINEKGEMVRVPNDQRGAVSSWKDLRLCLFKDQEEYDPEIASIEMMRPDERLEGARRGVFSNPLSNKSWQQYEAIMGGEVKLNATQHAIREIEEAGTAVTPSVERIYKTRDEPIKPEKLVRAICGAEAKNGQICKHVVPEQGMRCRWHGNKDN